MDENDVKKLWIHCNRCYKQYVHHKEASGSRFFLLACQDIACDKCVEAAPGRSPSDAPIYICPICRCKVRGRQINNAMPYHLKSLFHPEPWLDELRNEAIAGFQRKHMNRFLKYCQEKEKEVQKVDSDMTLALTACQKLYLELEQARQIRRQLENRAQQIKQQIKNNSVSVTSGSTCTSSNGPVIQKRVRLDARANSEPQISKPQKCQRKNPGITSFQHQPNHTFEL